eukprot:1205479-Prymnesium_polylepis.1
MTLSQTTSGIQSCSLGRSDLTSSAPPPLSKHETYDADSRSATCSICGQSQSHGSRMAVAWQSHGSRMAVARQSQSHGNRNHTAIAITRQSPSWRASASRSSCAIRRHRATCRRSSGMSRTR